MGIDLERIKDKLDLLKNGNKKNPRGEKRTWKPQKDKVSTIRILDYPFGSDPFVELWFHYGIGDKSGGSILCPKLNSGRSCPVCEFAQKLKESGIKEDYESAKKIVAKQRIYAVVVDRADPTATPKYWGFGKQVYETLLSYLMNEEYGNYMDSLSGLDLEVMYDDKTGKAWPSTELKFKRKESRLAENDKKTQEILSNIVPIDEVFRPLTVTEIRDRLNKWQAGDSESEDSETLSNEVIKGGGSENNQLGESNVEDLEGAFEEALSSNGLED